MFTTEQQARQSRARLAFDFFLAFVKRLQSNERPKRVTAILKKSRKLITTFGMAGGVSFVFLLSGCADAYYANNGFRAPEAKYSTYYAPDYYPYYPWDGYYGGAYYYGE